MVGSDKERPKGRVGSGSDNARGSPILNDDARHIDTRVCNRIRLKNERIFLKNSSFIIFEMGKFRAGN